MQEANEELPRPSSQIQIDNIIKNVCKEHLEGKYLSLCILSETVDEGFQVHRSPAENRYAMSAFTVSCGLNMMGFRENGGEMND